MSADVEQCLADIRSQPGVMGCALVDLATGMVLHGEGPGDLLPAVEAASDYWRLCTRQQRVFGAMGELRAQVVIHEHQRLTIVRCGQGLLLVTLSLESEPVDWVRWKQSTAALHRVAATL